MVISKTNIRAIIKEALDYLPPPEVTGLPVNFCDAPQVAGFETEIPINIDTSPKTKEEFIVRIKLDMQNVGDNLVPAFYREFKNFISSYSNAPSENE